MIELLTALVITLVLLTLALPGYQAYRHRVERVLAAQGLQQAAQCFGAQQLLGNNSEPNHCLPVATGTYEFRFVPLTGGLQPGHEWRAEPVGSQRGDGCGTLVLDHLGRRSVLGTPARGVSCWRGR